MAGKALLACGLVCFSWFLAVVYGRLIHGGREILTIKRAEARIVKEEDRLCERSVSDFVLQETINGLDSLTMTVAISLHRNGEVETCGSTLMPLKGLDDALHAFRAKNCPKPDTQSLDKYMVESLLTEFFAQSFSTGATAAAPAGSTTTTTCASTDAKRNKNLAGFRGYCDMGPDRTVPQPDSVHLVEGAMGNLPCRFYTREGVRISSLEQLVQLMKNVENDKTNPTCASSSTNMTTTTTTDDSSVASASNASLSLHLYAVPAGRVFMFAPQYVGEVFELPHVLDLAGNPLSLEVLSLNPRVFDIHNFFSEAEAQELIDKALHEQTETHKLHRSTTGTVGASVFKRRTSENAWDTHGPTATLIKKRCMSALGFDEYYESHTDGLQILRYNLTTAYVPHMDYLTDVATEKYDYRSEGRGGNRFATILLYMSDLEESHGGETVFSKGERILKEGEVALDQKEVIRALRKKGEIRSLKPGSWEETMTGQCRTKLVVRPQKSRAVLFYSQLPNGTEDGMSEHGGCPVLQGTKWAANLWAWNAARKEFDHAPFKFGQEEEKRRPSGGTFTSVSALFFNSGQDEKFNGARLFWHDQYFGELGAGESVRVNTYVSHVWNVKDRQGNTLHTWTITHASNEEQHFTV